MNVTHIKSFVINANRPSGFGDGYGGRYRLDDGTEVNVVTTMTGPGLESTTELQAERGLTSFEKQALLDADSRADHAKGQARLEPLPVQASY